MANSINSPIFNVPQAAAYLGVGKDILYTLAARDEIPHCHVGRHLRFHRADLEDYIRNSHRHQPLASIKSFRKAR